MKDKTKIKKQKTIAIIGVASLAIIFIVLAIINRRNNYQKFSPQNMILFYGATCPHCQTVAKYIDVNGIKNNLQFTELEVYNNRHNAALLAQYAQRCGLDTTQGIGVPLFWTGQKCLIGENEVINFFRDK